MQAAAPALRRGHANRGCCSFRRFLKSPQIRLRTMLAAGVEIPVGDPVPVALEFLGDQLGEADGSLDPSRSTMRDDDRPSGRITTQAVISDGPPSRRTPATLRNGLTPIASPPLLTTALVMMNERRDILVAIVWDYALAAI